MLWTLPLWEIYWCTSRKQVKYFSSSPQPWEDILFSIMIIGFGPIVLRNSSEEMYSMYVLTAGYPQCRKQNSISTLPLVHRQELEKCIRQSAGGSVVKSTCYTIMRTRVKIPAPVKQDTPLILGPSRGGNEDCWGLLASGLAKKTSPCLWRDPTLKE